MTDLPTVDQLDELVDVDPMRLRDQALAMRAEVEQLRARAERAEAEAVRLHKVAERAFTEMERGNIYDAEQTLREALLIPAMASQPAAPAPVAGGCTCDEDGPCPACTVDADALTGALTDEAHAPGGTHDH